MEKKINNIVIETPDGMEAYLEGNIVKFKPIEKKLTYPHIAEKLFDKKCRVKIESAGIIIEENNCNIINVPYPTNCTSRKQAEKLLAINKLMNVAKYLNEDWQPDWNNNYENKHYLRICNEKIEIGCATIYISDIVYFKSEGLAKQAIEILGEETIKLALCADW